MFELRTKELKKYHKRDATTDLGKLFRSCREASISLVRSRLKTWEAETNIVRKTQDLKRSLQQVDRKLLILKLYCNFFTFVFSYYSNALLFNLNLFSRLRRRSGWVLIHVFFPTNVNYWDRKDVIVLCDHPRHTNRFNFLTNLTR